MKTELGDFNSEGVRNLLEDYGLRNGMNSLTFFFFFKLILAAVGKVNCRKVSKTKKCRAAWVDPSVEDLTLDLNSGLNLRVVSSGSKFSSTIGLEPA